MDYNVEPTDQTATDPGSHSTAEQLKSLRRQVAEQQDQLRDYEKSLVERIADVDDDRRTTASKLQRAWQTQREEMELRLRRQTAMTMVLLVLFALVVGGVLFLAYRDLGQARLPLLEEIATVKGELDRRVEPPPADEAVGDALKGLSLSVAEISSSLERMSEEQASNLDRGIAAERSARDEADAGITEEVRGLEAEQQRLAQELASLRQALEEARAQAAADAPSAEPEAESAEAVPSTPETVGSAPEQLVAEPGAASEPVAEAPPADAEEAEADSEGEPAAEVRAEDSAGSVPMAGDRAYALQLIGFFSRDAMLTFAGRDDLPEQMYYREDRYRGRPWYALIHSLHADYASAEAALSQLAPDLVAMGPWIRPIRDEEDLRVLAPSE
jgi:DamX protein